MEITKTKEYKSYLKELTKLYKLLNDEQAEQLEIVMAKHRELNNKIDELCRREFMDNSLPTLNKLKKKIKG